MVARCAISWRIVVSVAVNALSHFQWFNLCNLYHGCHIAVARRANTGRAHFDAAGAVLDRFWVLSQVSDVRFMNEPDVIRQSMNSLPIYRMRFVANDARRGPDLRQRFAVFTADNLVAVRAELDGRHAGVCLRGNGAVAESAVHSEPLHLFARGVGVGPGPGVNSVREGDGLFDRLVEAEDRYWLSQPSCDDECQNRASDSYYAERP